MENESTSAINLRDFLEIIWRRKWLLVITVILITATATILTVRFVTPKYESSTELLQRDSGLDKALLGSDIFGSQNPSQPDRDLQTAAELVTSPQTTQAVNVQLADQLNGQDAGSFINVSGVNKTDILRITATHPDPVIAASIANEFANQYINWRRGVDQQLLAAARQPIESQMAAIPLEQQDGVAYKALQDKLESLKVMETVQMGNMEIVKQATAASQPSSPKPLRTGIISFIISLIAGIGLIFLIETLDTRVRTTEDIISRIDKPVLASIPALTQSEPGSLITLDHPASPGSEAYRLLKTNLAFAQPDKEIKSIMVTSLGPGDGKSTTIANLAITLARAGKRVIVLEGDFRRPMLAQYFSLDDSAGLTNAIAGQAELREILQEISIERMAVQATDGGGSTAPQSSTAGLNGIKPVFCATSGPLPPNPGELASSDKLGALIDDASQYADIVLVDAPPLGVVGDAASMSSRVDGIVYVIRLSDTSKKSLRIMQRFIDTVPGISLGVVATNSKLSGSYYAHSYGGYYQSFSTENV